MDDVTRVLAIRHGETAWNVDSRIQGYLDIPLNETGRRQASRLSKALAHEHIDVIYASDLQRAFDTAKAVADVVGLTVMAEPGLRERSFGSFEGKTFQEIEGLWPDLSLRWRKRDPSFGPPGGEPLQAFYDRVVGTAQRLAAAHPGKNIALFAHGGVLDCLYRAASRAGLQAPRSWQLANTSVNRLLYSSEGFTLVGWGDTSHLDQEGRDEVDSMPTPDRVGHLA